MRVVYVRCPTCNKVLSNKEYLYQAMTRSKISVKDALDQLELEVCCRIRMLGHADVSNDILEQKYYNFINPLNPPAKFDSHHFPELPKTQYVDNSVFTGSAVGYPTHGNAPNAPNADVGFSGGLFAEEDDIKII